MSDLEVVVMVSIPIAVVALLLAIAEHLRSEDKTQLPVPLALARVLKKRR